MIRITRPLTTTPAPKWLCDQEDFIIITIIYRSNYIVLAGGCEGRGDLHRILAPPSVSQLWLLSLLCAVRRVSHQTDGSWAERRGLCPGPRHDRISAARGAGPASRRRTEPVGDNIYSIYSI